MAKIQDFSIEKVYCSVFFSLTLDKRYKDVKGNYQVSVRVTHNYKKSYVRTGLCMDDTEFEKMMRASKGKYYDLRKEQENIFYRVYEIAKKLIDANTFSLSLLMEKMKVSTSDSFSFNDLVNEKIKTLIENGQAKTARSYQAALAKFEVYYGGSVPFGNISSEMMVKFKDRMDKDNLSKTTISIYLRCIRSICNLAISRHLLNEEQYPFSRNTYEANKVKIPKGAKRKEHYLTIPEILKLLSYDTEEHRNDPHGSLLCQALNLWLFSYLGNGMNLADMATLSYDSHYYKMKGSEFAFQRQKTAGTAKEDIIIYVPLIPKMKEILTRYAEKSSRGTLVFPFILSGEKDPGRTIKRIDEWNKRIGKRMKEICKAVGIEAEVTMTWARHSFKTNLMRKNVPAFYTEQAMGHVDNSVADNYTALCTPEMRMKYNSLLLEPDKGA